MPTGIQTPRIIARLGPLFELGIYPPLASTLEEVIGIPAISEPEDNTELRLLN